MSTGSGSVGAPLYEQIKHTLRAAIAAEEYDADRPFITEREVCARFGVSTTTAVRALNELVVEGVLFRRRGRGTFVADRRAEPRPGGGAGPDRLVACIMHGQGPHRSAILAGVQSACTGLGYRLLLFDSAGNPEQEAAALREAAACRVAGVVLYPVQGQPNVEQLDELRRAAVPVVMVDRYRPDVATDAVVIDNYAVGYAITNELIRLGHRRIATLWHETQCTAVRDRLTGHLQALREHELPHLPALTELHDYADLPNEPRRRRLRSLLDMNDPPTVLLCAHGYLVATAINDLIGLGVDIPEQVDLAGMDNAGPYDLLPLTSAAAVLPSEEMGSKAMQLLAKRIEEKNPHHAREHIVLPVRITTRESAPGHLRVVGRPKDLTPTG